MYIYSVGSYPLICREQLVGTAGRTSGSSSRPQIALHRPAEVRMRQATWILQAFRWPTALPKMTLGCLPSLLSQVRRPAQWPLHGYARKVQRACPIDGATRQAATGREECLPPTGCLTGAFKWARLNRLQETCAQDRPWPLLVTKADLNAGIDKSAEV